MLRTLALTLALCYAAVAPAQYALSTDKLADVPVETMPTQDNAALLAEEEAARKPGRPETFAVTIPTTIRPATHGRWVEEGGTSIWRTRISSPGARTLNLGFSEYNLPEGGELYLLSPEERFGPFTAADNEDHNQLWTPLVEGDEIMVELQVPTALKSKVQLYLTAVNHDFIDVRNKFLPQQCNIDVVCSEADGYGIVDNYRDIIRSVAAYTIGGRDVCTGFLVNNVNQDGTPLFMTAAHCGVGAANAPQLVAYWNYENSFCRDVVLGGGPNSPGSDGSRSTTNMGASWLATYGPSDMTILLFEEPINPAANAFFAGWSAEAEVPTDTMIAVHHPGVQEKRISFSFQDTYRAAYFGAPDPDADHLEVPFWDIGTTEGGSSGSPVFDRFKRVRGQLHGGRASCTLSDEFDSYGYFHTSWEGGGTPNSRLRDWLDPCGSGTLTIDGFDSANFPAILTTASNCLTACTITETNVPFTLGTDYPTGTTLEITTSAPGISPTLSTATATGGETVSILIPGDVTNIAGVYEITVTATSADVSDDITFTIAFTDDIAPTPVQTFPAEDNPNVNPIVTLAWDPVANISGYDLQVSEDDDFANIFDARMNTPEVSVTLLNALTRNTTYFWRVRAVNECGGGEWSTSSFSTADLGCALDQGEGLPVTITGRGGEEKRIPLTMEPSFLIDGSMEVLIDIDHSYLGDIDGRLRSPSGTEIQLFNRPGNGGCAQANLSVTFSDDAEMDNGDFNNTCDSGPLGISGTFQPLQPFSIFDGEDASGVWTLIITDNADGDGGRIDRFNLSFCTTGTVAELSLRSSTDMLDVCQSNDETSLVLDLGADFAGDVVLTANANGQSLDNFTTSYSAQEQTIDVLFTAWTLGPGAYDLDLVVTNGDGAMRTLTIPLVVSTGPAQASLNAPAADAEVQEGEVSFTWALVPGADDYLFQYSTTEDFATIAFEQQVLGTVISLNDLPTDDPIFWRVVSRDECGETFSEVRQLSVNPSGVHDFGGGRELFVYPNPVKRLLTIEATGSWPNGVNGTLFDATGRQLSAYRMAGNGLEQWDLGSLPAGVYYLRFMGLGTERTERLVVLP